MDLKVRGMSRGSRNPAAGQPSGQGDPNDHGRGDPGPMRCLDQDAATHRPHEDGHKGSHLHQGVPPDDFMGFQMIGHDAVLDRPEKGGLGAHEKQKPQKDPSAVGPESDRRNGHDEHLGHFDPANQDGFLRFIGDLAGRCREEEKGQNEKTGGQVDNHIGRQRQGLSGLKGDQQHEGVLENVVIQCAQELGPEKRCETSRCQQVHHPAAAGRRWWWRRVRTTVDINGHCLCGGKGVWLVHPVSP
ncbi:hypothetical protein DESC_610122 [Desulfosarcina cetonica]|nr:hypothetical protein DESC_610122 [Desulfosarcina cetonica]